MKLEHYITPYPKINPKWIKDLNVRLDTIKLLEENIGKTLFDINHSKTFFDPPSRVMEIKTKINKWGDFPGGTVVKNPPASAGDMGSSTGLGRSHMPQSN